MGYHIETIQEQNELYWQFMTNFTFCAIMYLMLFGLLVYLSYIMCEAWIVYKNLDHEHRIVVKFIFAMFAASVLMTTFGISTVNVVRD